MRQILLSLFICVFGIIIYGYLFSPETQIDIKINYDEINSKIENFKNNDLFELKYSTELPITSIDKMDKTSMKYKIEAYLTNLQGLIVDTLQKFELKQKFTIERNMHPNGGGEIVALLQDGITFERAILHLGVVKGILPPGAVKVMREKTKIKLDSIVNYDAVSLSCVIHAKNPYVPTIHFNYRYFEATDSTGYSEWWFGGGTDLTPIYLNENDTIHFHKILKQACDTFSPTFYSETKSKCDKYFYIAHRREHRGVGGVFFDDLDTPNQESVFSLIKALGDAVLPGYVPIIKENINKQFSEKEREWQLIRRGRYVEFNLVYDRGTKFGLQMPNAPIESILMTLPLNAQWKYKFSPTEDSPESKLMEVLKKPREWL